MKVIRSVLLTSGRTGAGGLVLSFVCFAVVISIAGCCVPRRAHEIKLLERGGIDAEELKKGGMINSFHAYLKELDNNVMLKKIKKNAGQHVFYIANTEPGGSLPYEQAYAEGMKYYSASKFEDAVRCFKRALSYPDVPAFKTLEIKFSLMDSLRQSGRESEYSSQLNEYKQKYKEITGAADAEFLLNQQISAIIFTALEKSGEKLNANIEANKTGR